MVRQRRLLLRACFLLLLPGASALASPDGDFYALFRGTSLLSVDESYAVRDRNGPEDAPPLFRIRHLRLRLREPGSEEKWWPARDLFLLRFPGGRSWVLERVVVADRDHLDAPAPWERVVSTGGGVLEMWTVPDPDVKLGDTEALEQSIARPSGSSPCGGFFARLKGAGRELDFVLTELSTRTVTAAIADVRNGVLGPEELLDLALFRRLEEPLATAGSAYGVLLPGVLLKDRGRPDASTKTLALVPDSGPPLDLSPFRALTNLPFDLPRWQEPEDSLQP